MASVQVSFPPDLEWILRSEIWNYKTDPPHKVFDGFAERGCCSMGWFYGFKLHLICNERGELPSFAFTKGNIDDRKPLEDKQFIKDIYGKLVVV